MGQEAELEIQNFTALGQHNAAGSWNVEDPDGNNSIPMWRQEKLGAKCCGCCCDYRRAVIIMTIFSIVPSIITMFTTTRLVTMAPQLDMDDELVSVLKDDEGVTICLMIVILLTSISGLLGALKYKTNLVIVNIIGWVGTYICAAAGLSLVT